MRPRAREVAKFFAGVAASETLSHWLLGICGRDMLPMKFGWLTFTAQWNWFAMAGWPVALAALIYFGWVRRPACAGAINASAPLA